MSTEDTPSPETRKTLADCAETLAAALTRAQESAPASRLHLLLDPAVTNATEDPAFASSIERAGEKPVALRWVHPKLRADHRPLILSLDLSRNLGSEMLARSLQMAFEDAQPDSLRHGHGNRIGGWLVSEGNALGLARHLGPMAVQTLPKGMPPEAGRRRLLRFFDPLVFPVLWEMSDAPQRAEWMGPVQQWWCLDTGPRLRCFTEPASRPPPATDWSDVSAPLRQIWDTVQWQLLLSLDAFNPVMIEQGVTPHPAALRPRVLATLRRLYEQGIHDPLDLRHMTRLALDHHPAFDQHPRIQELLAGRPPGQLASKALSCLAPDDWRDIQDQLRSAA